LGVAFSGVAFFGKVAAPPTIGRARLLVKRRRFRRAAVDARTPAPEKRRSEDQRRNDLRTFERDLRVTKARPLATKRIITLPMSLILTGMDVS